MRPQGSPTSSRPLRGAIPRNLLGSQTMPECRFNKSNATSKKRNGILLADRAPTGVAAQVFIESCRTGCGLHIICLRTCWQSCCCSLSTGGRSDGVCRCGERATRKHFALFMPENYSNRHDGKGAGKSCITNDCLTTFLISIVCH